MRHDCPQHPGNRLRCQPNLELHMCIAQPILFSTFNFDHRLILRFILFSATDASVCSLLACTSPQIHSYKQSYRETILFL